MKEKEIQIEIVKKLEEKGFLVIHIPNGGKRNQREAMELRKMGVKAGVPDLLVFSRPFLLAIEVKGPGGRLSEDQKQFMKKLHEVCVPAIVARSWEDVERIIKFYKLKASENVK